jgi:hypothetical protein
MFGASISEERKFRPLDPLDSMEDLVAHSALANQTYPTKSKLRFRPLLPGALPLAVQFLHVALDGGGHAPDRKLPRKVRKLEANDVCDVAS